MFLKGRKVLLDEVSGLREQRKEDCVHRSATPENPIVIFALAESKVHGGIQVPSLAHEHVQQSYGKLPHWNHLLSKPTPWITRKYEIHAVHTPQQ